MKVARSLIIFLALSLCLIPRGMSKAGGAPADESAVRQAEELLVLSARQNRENHSLALQTAERALELWQTAGDKAGTARAYAQIAVCQLAQSNLPEAAENYQRELQLWRDLGNLREQAGVLIMLGFVEVRRGEWLQAISFFTDAQGLFKEGDEPFYSGQIASGLGYIFNETGLPDSGLIQYQRALDYFLLTEGEHDNTRSVFMLGYTHYLLGHYPEALEHFQRALASFEPGSVDIAQSHDYLGRVYLAMGQYEVALPHLELALAMYTGSVNPREAAQVRGLLGKLYGQQGRLPRARQYYQQALATFNQLSDRINQAAIYYALGQLETKAGDYGAAEGYLRQSVEVTEDMRRTPSSSDLIAAFSATVHERYESYIECLMRRREAEPSQDYAVRAFETNELARARSLAEMLRETQTNLAPADLDPQLAGREKTLRQALRAKEDYKVALLGKDYRKEELAALNAELARLENEYGQVTEAIRALHPTYGQITQPAAWSLRRIQEEVIADDETVLLEYSLGADRSYVWAVTRDHFRSYELPAEPVIHEAAQKVYKAVTDPPAAGAADESAAAARELGRLVLSPVAAELNKRRIIVVADGPLHYVPFQLLVEPSAGDELLVDRYEIVNTPSASILGELRQEAARRRPAAKTLAAFGDPVFQADYAQRKDNSGSEQLASLQTPDDERWRQALREISLNGSSPNPSTAGRLFYAKLELANLRKVTAGEETFVAADFDATPERLRGTDLSEFAVLHFATHGYLNPFSPENSGLLLTSVTRDGRPLDGFVRLQDVYNLRAPVTLVVLSACNTALGKEVRGEGLLGLTRGFMYAGASSVLSSLWEVNDEATAELMKRFYDNLLQRGMTPAEALRAAQNSIRREPQWRSPYYWAGFTLQGEYRQVIRPARGAAASTDYTMMTAAAVVLGLLAGAAVWLVRRRAGGYSAAKK